MLVSFVEEGPASSSFDFDPLALLSLVIFDTDF